MEYIQLTLFGKTFPERSVQTKERISGEFSKKSQKPKFQYLKVRNGQKADWSNYQTVQSLGELLTPNIGVSPNVAVESTLSQILEVNAPQKYYLSSKACQGILRRAEKRGKDLPPLLKAALEAQAEGKFLVTSGTDFESTGVQFVGTDVYNGQITGDTSVTLTANGGCSAGHSGPTVLQAEILDMTHANDVIRECGDTCPTLQARMGTGGNQIPLVFEPKNNVKCLTSWDCQSKRIFDVDGSYPCLQAMDCGGANNTAVLTVEPAYSIQGNTIDRSDTAGANGKGVIEGKSYTLNTVDRHAVCHSIGFCPNNISTAAGLSEVDERSPTLSTTKLAGVCYARSGFGEFVESDVTGTLRASAAEHGVSSQDIVVNAVAYNEENITSPANRSNPKIGDPCHTLGATGVSRSLVGVCHPINTQVVTRYNKLGEGTGMGIGDDGDPAYTLQAAHSHGVIYAIDRAAFNQGENAKYNFQIENDGVNSTIVARGPSAVLDCRLAVWIVRRLTPRECERLQGFPDDWTMYDAIGNELKDTPRYKALGNSIAIPCALRVFQGIVGTEAAS